MTTDMLFAIEREVVRESETGASTKTRSYAFDALGQRATLSENGSRYSYVVDQRESVEALLDQTNGIKAAYGYRAYGEANPSLTKTAGGFTPSTNLYRYSGKRFDPAAKAYDMGARHYFPSQARWFQQDLYADALDNLGLSTDPLNSNRYLFTGANPINYIELDGHAAGAVGPTYDGGTGDPDPTRQAGLMADAFVRLGCRSTQRAECAGAISGIEQQLRLYSNQKLLCAQTRDARHCTAGAGRKSCSASQTPSPPSPAWVGSPRPGSSSRLRRSSKKSPNDAPQSQHKPSTRALLSEPGSARSVRPSACSDLPARANSGTTSLNRRPGTSDDLVPR